MLEALVRLFVVLEIVAVSMVAIALIRAGVEIHEEGRAAAERWTIDPETLPRSRGVA